MTPRRSLLPLLGFLLLSVPFNAVLVLGMGGLLDVWRWARPPSDFEAPTVMELVRLTPDPATTLTPEEEQKLDELDELEEKKDDELDGQIVEIAPPERPERPDQADYLAEFDNKVDEETRPDRFMVNPEVLARQYSEEQKVQLKGENVPDLDITNPSTGATAMTDQAEQKPEHFDPDRNGLLARVPSQFQLSNKDGLEAPVPSSALQSVLQGAPQNDRINEKRGTEKNLNTKEFLYASYLNRIRRLVNFYWNQNLDSLPSSVRLARPEYTTVVDVVLDSSGGLDVVEVSRESGSGELDDCVVRAFRVAGPFPNPPDGLVEKDGRAYLPQMGFTVTLGVAQMHYEGIDPRAGVQYPGLLKSPR